MSQKRIFISIFSSILLGLIFLIVLFRIPKKQNDVIQLNRIYQEVTLHINSLSSGDYSDFTYPFAVISLQNEVLYQHGISPDTTMASALEHGDTIFSLKDANNREFATLLITTNLASSFDHLKLYAIILVAIVILGTICIQLYDYFYIRKHIINPCRQMQRFSNNIASGNLDIQLPIAKDNIFGSFTESFDLMREELSHARQQERLATQSKKELVASLSHDIKTPITSIQLTTELLLVTTKEEMTKQKLLTIAQKTEQINSLVTDLFHATLEDLEELKVNVVEIYSSTLEAMLKECDSNDLMTISHIPDCILLADPIRLRQVFSNIIYNSYKYAKTSIRVSFALNETHLEVHIQDFGPGVNEHDLPLIFNKFYRGENSVHETGSGLGLYICKQILNQMQSEIYCSNNDEGFETLILLKLAFAS
ncbi:MAG: HAMP domain-containing sensor histidine kinase [Clostridiales bacterium]|nr:HAMP domain-containing sensor histidine kinase [Clostridiales bacterium]